MENKTDLQDNELNSVNGGTYYPVIEKYPCPSCGAKYYKKEDYPKGFLVSFTQHACSDDTYKYKCPACGYEWQVG